MTGGRIRQLARMAGGHRCRRLPVAVIMPTPRCNCRCAMCGFWQPHGSREELSRDDVETALQGFSALGAEQLVVSGGEPLLYEGLWQMCCLARKLGKLGGRRLLPPETFHVEGREGPLCSGEVERARAWTETVLAGYGRLSQHQAARRG